MTHLGVGPEREGVWPSIDTPNTIPWSIATHICRPVHDPSTTEQVCPTCGLVMAPPVFTTETSLRSGLTGGTGGLTTLTVWGRTGGRRTDAPRMGRNVGDADLQRALHLDAIGYLGRTTSDRLMKRWYAFLRTATGFDLTGPMLQDALLALQKIRASGGTMANLSNVCVDYALIHVVLREHRRPLPRGKMIERLAERRIPALGFIRAIKTVRKITGLGVEAPRSSDYLWAVSDQLPAAFLRKVREVSRAAASIPALQNVLGETLAAGIVHAVMLSAPEPQRALVATPETLCDTFGIAEHTLLESSRMVRKIGLVAVAV